MPANASYSGFGANGGTRSSEPIKKYVNDQLNKLWRLSVRAFVLEASKHVRIDTGMSAASMLPLATDVRLRSFLNAQIQSQSKGPKKRDRGGETKVLESRALGERVAEAKQNHRLEFGTPEQPGLLFTFDIVIFQYFLQENGLGYRNKKGPQDSLLKGEEAFLDAFSRNFEKFVDPKIIGVWLTTGRVPSG